ncbi:MAG TPA: hypothetical protein VKS79_05810 [Gemmataceae bacterium]|nr:hypothetical protein [Gemmataceae bacterium]
MFIMFGTRTYGKVDHLPGLFYVSTSFIHINFVPLCPTESYLVIDDGKQRGMKIGMSGKSIFFAWARALAFAGGIGLACLGVFELAEHHTVPAAVLIATGILGILFFFFSYKLTRPGPRRALRIARQAGIAPEVLARYFVETNMLQPEELEQLLADYRTDDDAVPVEEVLPADEEYDRPQRRYRN